jgi:hypothetical protein
MALILIPETRVAGTHPCCVNRPGAPISIAHCSGPTLRIVDRQHDPAVWIGPLELLDGSLNNLRLLPIEHCIGMVRKSRHGGDRDP